MPLVAATGATVPRSTSIDDLLITPIANPNGAGAVRVLAVGDGFVAVSRGTDQVPGLWERGIDDEWRAVALPAPLAAPLVGATIESVERIGGRVLMRIRALRDPHDPTGLDRTMVLSGPGLDSLSVDPVTAGLADPRFGPAAPVDPAILGVPVGSNGVRTRGHVEAFAAGPAGIVAVGSISATLNLDLLPAAVVELVALRPGYSITVGSGRVEARSGGRTFSASTAELGLTHDEASYLERPAEARRSRAVWVAAPGEPLQLVASSEFDGLTFDGDAWGVLDAVADGYVLEHPSYPDRSRQWWSADGRRWTELAPTGSSEGQLPLVVELGHRWVRTAEIGSTAAASRRTNRQVSDDHGRTWQEEALTSGRLLGFGGAAGLGVFAFGHPLDAFANPTYPGTVFYSPDGEHWSSRALPELFSLDSLALTFAAAPTAAVVVARRAVAHPASETELFLVTRRPPTP